MRLVLFLFCCLLIFASCSKKPTAPNIIIIFCDDLGYGDIGCFGSTVHRTPNIDAMAQQGIKLTSFYVTSSVCTPSRSSLLTGCYAQRVNMHQDHNDLCVLFPKGKKGLNPNEVTIAEVLKKVGYANACIGKWHLGDQAEFLPTRQGFDMYYGIPYSNDMGSNENNSRPPLPLLQDETVIEAPVEQTTITRRYTQKAVEFIKEHRDQPFFLYMPHTMPHNPVYASEDFAGRSANGGYGDSVEEIDWSVGQILQTLEELDLKENTLVLFTSDNGAAQRWGGSNGPLRGWKGSTWEGGQRVCAVAQWPDHIPNGFESDALTSTLDIMPTLAHLAGAELPLDRKLDGVDISSVLTDKATNSPRDTFYFYQMDQLQAVRSGKWKLYVPLNEKIRNWGPSLGPQELQLYDLESDIGETTNVADRHPDIVNRLNELAKVARRDLGDLGKPGENQRPAGWVELPQPLLQRP